MLAPRSTRTTSRLVPSLLAVTGIVAAAVVAATARTPVAADHDEAAGSVTLVGSLQSELGCPDDWSPPCPATAMTTTPDGSWSITVEVPAGSWAWKVALDGTWDRSYPSADVPLVLQGATRLTFSYDDVSHRVAVAPAEPPEGVTSADRARAGTSLRDDLTRERFYFVMTDRFENADEDNDTGGIPGGRLDHGFDPTHKGFYHGGDLPGLISQLDYIQGLGTTAIWLTPSFKNRPVQGEDPFISAGYHGYWITDFTQVDPHFGTNDDLRELVDRAHARGMKVFFDIITNHTADVIAYVEGPANNYNYIDKATAPYIRSDTLQPFDDRDFVDDPDFPPLDPDVSFPYTPTFPTVEDETVKVPAWLNDPIYYHNRGNTDFVGEDAEYGDFFGLDDLFTEHPDVVAGMTDIYEAWVDFGIDGFRIDTAKHVNVEFWQVFARAIAERAVAAENDDFFAFGEVFDPNPAFMSRYTTEAGLQATLDFGFQARASGFAQGRPTVELRDLFADDDYYTDTDSNAYSLPTFLGNHDMGRIGKFIADSGAAGDELLTRDRLAHSLMYLSRGQPVVYYGDEQGFVGDGGDQDARQDMFASQVNTYNDDDLIGTDATTAERNFDTAHPLYRHLADLSRLRAQHPALADGAQIHRYASRNAGVYAFSRIDPHDEREYVVALNNSETAQTVTFDTFSEKAKYRGLWPSRTADVRSDAEGRVTVTVPPLSVLVWRAQSDLDRQRHAPAMFFRTPGPGGTVGGRADVGVAVPDDGFNQVTLLWRPAGTAEWRPLGTDDNAPYRVFHDVTGLARGTMVEYRAVLRDHSGNLSVAQTYATVGDPAPPGDDGGDGGGPVVQPDAVSVPGSANDEMGCPGEWQPECDQAQLTLDPDDQIWKGTFDLPAGNYEFKVAINRSWTENYGAGGAPNGANIPFTHPGGPVTFYYDHGTHWVTNDVLSDGNIITAPGSAQSELGCPADWSPDCMRPWLQDPDGDGVWTWTTTEIPAGSYEVKVTHGLTWDENYGAGGAPNGANIPYTVPSNGTRVTFSYVLATHVLTVATSTGGPVQDDIARQEAHWLERDLLAWNLPAAASGWHFRLHAAPAGGLVVDEEAILGGESFPLTLDPRGLPAKIRQQWPHLASYDALRLSNKDARDAEGALTGQLAIAAYDDLGRLVDATGLQIPGVLDDVYDDAYDRDLGVTWRSSAPKLAVWAPTAKDVDLLLRPPGQSTDTRVQLRRDDDGVWSATGRREWAGATYLFEVDVYVPAEDAVLTNLVTDPYAVALTTDSARSVLVDLDDASLRPAGWNNVRKPELRQPEDSTIYELHVRDFSITDETVPADHRGTYLAFTDSGSAGMQHLRRLAGAGLNTVHLLPVFDIATIPERRADQATPACDLESFGPASEEQQACVDAVAATDGFNWGYDPWHYTTPEGSYATDPEGPTRTREFRQMVAALNGAGLRVVMDVVYNHTTASGQAAKSVLDRIVPGYYHRLSATGTVETSTCCQNTATEHRMMEKLMVDSVVTWARAYKVDGFRFDLMGHHSLANMLAVREALDDLTLEHDGVDGRRIYVYGEGWDFGEVAGGARFRQARQLELFGSGIGSFTDRLRDAVRGGGPFDANPRIQGFATGLYTDPNGDAVNGTPEQQLQRLLLHHDQIKVGLAGNLRDYEFVDRTGATVTGAGVDYNGQPAGYAGDPSETITYVDAHDNEALFDNVQYKLPQSTSMADRVRMNTVALATTALAQSPSFWHAGTDLLRSKSLDRNSFDSGDWFNRIDWSATESTWGSGLPRRGDNESKWDFMRPLLEDPALEPAPADLAAATRAAAELLEIRFSSPLFRLGSAERIQERVGFPIGGPAQPPGVITMTVDDRAGRDLDRRWEGIVVVFNASPDEQTQTVPALAGEPYDLHPVQAGGGDDVVKTATYDEATGTFTVPARTVAVFVGT